MNISKLTHKRSLLAILIAVYAHVFMACSGETVIVCPDGRYYTNGLCCPLGTVGADNTCAAPPPDVLFVPNDSRATQDQGIPQPDQAPSLDTSVTDTKVEDAPSQGDVNQDTQQSPGQVGSPCIDDTQCLESGLCLSWNQGYCTIPGCQAQGTCPDGSVCAAVGQSGACLDLCDDQDPCRTQDAQFCKEIFDSAGEISAVCFGTQTNANGLGGSCASHEECAQQLACYQGVPGGICVINGCTPGSCGDEGSCVSIDGVPRCLKNCSQDTDCGGDDLQRACVEKSTITGTETNVCFVPSGSAPIGAACTGGFLCETSYCEITATGVCSVDQSIPCDEIQDCPSGQTCNIAPAFTQGFCSKECDFTSTQNCVGSHCVA